MKLISGVARRIRLASIAGLLCIVSSPLESNATLGWALRICSGHRHYPSCQGDEGVGISFECSANVEYEEKRSLVSPRRRSVGKLRPVLFEERRVSVRNDARKPGCKPVLPALTVSAAMHELNRAPTFMEASGFDSIACRDGSSKKSTARSAESWTAIIPGASQD